jgi:histidinol-phosphate aminotransferase
MDSIARYPDGNGFYLKESISKFYQIQSDNIILGNGSNDVIEMVARAFLNSNDNVVFSEYAFIVYKLVVKSLGTKFNEISALDYGHDIHKMIKSIDKKTKIIFIANPNNPTGSYFSNKKLFSLLKSVPKNCLIVLDQAYEEYLPANEIIPLKKWLNSFENIIVMRTFSKAYGLAAFRVGWGAASSNIIEKINRIRQPFNVNLFGLHIARHALIDQSFIKKTVSFNKINIEKIEKFLFETNITFIPSKANFVTFYYFQSQKLNRYFMENGLIVRPLDSYGLKNFIRVSIGTTKENNFFMKLLEKFLKKNEQKN